MTREMARLANSFKKQEEEMGDLKDLFKAQQEEMADLKMVSTQSQLDNKLTQVDIADLKAKFEQTESSMDGYCERLAATVGVFQATSNRYDSNTMLLVRQSS